MVTGVGRNRHDLSTVRAAVAAGHPATVEAGIEALEAGGSAANAAVAAGLASCVAETVMTGLLGGGHAIHYDAAAGRMRDLARPATPARSRSRPRRRDAARSCSKLQVPFGTELVHYAVGIASCGVPGLPAGLGALHSAHGRLPWERLVEPALRLASDGVEFPPAHAACLEVPTGADDERRRDDLLAGRHTARGGWRLRQPGLVRALELLGEEGPTSAYEGSLGRELLELMEERGGLVTRDDLVAYEATWSEPAKVTYAGSSVLTRAGLAPLGRCLEALPQLRGRPAASGRWRSPGRSTGQTAPVTPPIS